MRRPLVASDLGRGILEGWKLCYRFKKSQSINGLGEKEERVREVSTDLVIQFNLTIVMLIIGC